MLANGRRLLAIPGPSVMPDAVLQAMHRAAPNIYTGELHDITHALIPDLKTVARTDRGHAAIYICNGHGVWEAALANILNPGDAVLVPATGRFGHGWAEMARSLGAEVEVMDFGQTSAFDTARIGDRLRADAGHRIKAVLATHVDTSTSAKNDIAALRAVMDAAGHPALLAADCIASLGCDRFEFDAWGVDVMVAASQKGLMVPPGLGFVWFSDKADAVRGGVRVSAHWDWRPRVRPEMYHQYFNGTAPTHHIYGLRAALDMIAAEGMEAIWHRHAVLARAIWAAFDVWGQGGPMALNIADPAARSHAVTSCVVGSPHGDRLRAWCEGMAGVTLGIGLGREPADGYFRIGHMGHVNAHMVLGTLAVIDAGLKALAIPHGQGALDAAAQVIADATTGAGA